MAPDEGAAFHFAPASDASDARDAANDSTPTNYFDPLSVAAPEFSARDGVTQKQIQISAWLSVLFVIAAIALPEVWTALLIGAAIIVFAALIVLRWAAALAPTERTTENIPPDVVPFYSILCPVYREAGALPGLVASLDALHYPRKLLDVLILVEPDDRPTRQAAEDLAQNRPWLNVISAPLDGPRTKPKALNSGLAAARGELLVVFDAEDRPHSEQLIAAASAFATGGADLACVQAPLGIYNPKESWIAGQFALEYSVQFRRLLPLFAKLGWPILLGGTSNHFRTAILRNAHGWDSYNVTEDADLGLRLARSGFRTGVIAPPTYEEAPISFGGWRRQRTRWIKGHLMTWCVHMRRPSQMLRELGSWGFAGAQLTLGGGVLSSFVHGPLLLWAIWELLRGQGFGAAWALAFAGYAGAFICALRAAQTSHERFSLWPALSAPLYWPLQSIAACIALAELITAPHVWSKTEHGLTKTLAPIADAQIASPMPDALDVALLRAAE